MKAARRCANCRRPLGDYSRSVGLRRVCGAACQRSLRLQRIADATGRIAILKRERGPLLVAVPQWRKPLPRVNRKRRARLFGAQYGGGYAGVVRLAGCVVDRISREKTGLPAGCDGRVQAAHVRSRGAGGKASDLVGLCANHHAEQHRMGIKSFQAFYGVDLAAEAAALWKDFGHLATILERGR